MNDIPRWVYFVTTAVTAIGVLTQAIVLLGILIALKRALGRVNEISKLAEEHLIPTLGTARKVLEEVSPKIRTTVQNLLEASQTIRAQTTHVNATVDDLLKKTEVQADRVDEMVTGTLNSIATATSVLQRAMSSPVRQIGAVLDGLRAGFDVLRSKEPEVHAAADGDHFV